MYIYIITHMYTYIHTYTYTYTYTYICICIFVENHDIDHIFDIDHRSMADDGGASKKCLFMPCRLVSLASSTRRDGANATPSHLLTPNGTSHGTLIRATKVCTQANRRWLKFWMAVVFCPSWKTHGEVWRVLQLNEVTASEVALVLKHVSGIYSDLT